MANLFYVIGASGVGKDSLLHFARNNISQNDPVVFTHRYITRPSNAGGENHIALSQREFERRKQLGCFAMSWHSHNNGYGIGIEINQWLAMGLDVVVNGSREYLPYATDLYPTLIPVLISTNPERLRERLINRGREKPAEIEQRLIKAQALDIDHPRLVTISNDGELGEAGQKLVSLIQGKELLVCA